MDGIHSKGLAKLLSVVFGKAVVNLDFVEVVLSHHIVPLFDQLCGYFILSTGFWNIL